MNNDQKNIVLTGFRATGKSTLGKMLAQRLGYVFIDTDVLLCERLGASIAETVARYGWAYFRQAERQLLLEIPTMTRTVLATGGGAIEHQEEWAAMRNCCVTIWLDADIETIRSRMEGDIHSAGQRPSLTGRSSSDEIEELLRKRRPLYAAGSDIRLETGDLDTTVLVNALVDALQALKLRKKKTCAE